MSKIDQSTYSGRHTSGDARRAVLAATGTLLLAALVLAAGAYVSFDESQLLGGGNGNTPFTNVPGAFLLLLTLLLVLAAPFAAARAGRQQHWRRIGLRALLSALPTALVGSFLALSRDEGTAVVTTVLVLGVVLAVALPPRGAPTRWRRTAAVTLATAATFALASTELVVCGPVIALAALLVVA